MAAGGVGLDPLFILDQLVCSGLFGVGSGVGAGSGVVHVIWGWIWIWFCCWYWNEVCLFVKYNALLHRHTMKPLQSKRPSSATTVTIYHDACSVYRIQYPPPVPTFPTKV